MTSSSPSFPVQIALTQIHSSSRGFSGKQKQNEVRHKLRKVIKDAKMIILVSCQAIVPLAYTSLK